MTELQGPSLHVKQLVRFYKMNFDRDIGKVASR